MGTEGSVVVKKTWWVQKLQSKRAGWVKWNEREKERKKSKECQDMGGDGGAQRVGKWQRQKELIESG